MQKTVRILKDKFRTRIDFQSVTSYSQDYDVNYSARNEKINTLILSIGSAVIKLVYLNEADRDVDVIKLDNYFGVAVED